MRVGKRGFKQIFSRTSQSLVEDSPHATRRHRRIFSPHHFLPDANGSEWFLFIALCDHTFFFPFYVHFAREKARARERTNFIASVCISVLSRFPFLPPYFSLSLPLPVSSCAFAGLHTKCTLPSIASLVASLSLSLFRASDLIHNH